MFSKHDNPHHHISPGGSQVLTSFSAFFFFDEDNASTSPEWLKHMPSTPVVRLRTERSGLGRLSLRQDSSYMLTTPDADLREAQSYISSLMLHFAKCSR